jgi:galactose-1-phosphate uridylyltransferase
MPSMMWIHQRPFVAGRPGPRLHLHIAPYFRAPGTARFVAAAEVGGHVYFNPVDPVDAAVTLRATSAPT